MRSWTCNGSSKLFAMSALAAVVLMGWVGASTAQAVPIALVNAGFEAADLFPAPDRIAGWTTDPSGASAAPTTVPHTGAQALQLYGPTPGALGIRQDTGHALLADTAYTASVWVRKFPSDPVGTLLIQLFAGDPFGGGTFLNETTIDPGSITTTYQQISVGYNSPSSGPVIGQDLWIRLTQSDAGSGRFGLFDDVEASFVPEPAALGLLGLGSLAFATRRRA